MTIYLITGLVFVGLSLLLFLIIYAIVPRRTIAAERLESMTPVHSETYYLQKPETPWQKFLARLGRRVPVRPQEYGKYRRTLVAAGIRPEMLPAFLGAKILLLLGLPGAYLIFYGMPFEPDFRSMVIIAAILMIVGFLLPSYWLGAKVRERKLRLFYDLPDVLDLMTVCVEAGLSMEAAMIRIAEDSQFRASPLSKELRVATQETRAGKSRTEALKDMGERTMLDDLKAFATMLIQTEQLGTSLAQALRIHSDSLRTIRRQMAEEEAAKTSIKLLFPLVFLIMPAMFVVMLMPALLRLMRVFSNI